MPAEIDSGNIEQADEIVRRLKFPPKPKFRNLSAAWIVDPIIDLSSSKGLDLEKEIMYKLAKSIAEEIDEELISKLLSELMSFESDKELRECLKNNPYTKTYSVKK